MRNCLARHGLSIVFMLALSMLFLTPTASGVNVDSCQNLTTAGTYVLTQNIVTNTSSICIQIKEDNITLDCMNFNITFEALNQGYTAIYDTRNNTIIRNCNIRLNTGGKSYVKGIYSVGCNTTIYNNTIHLLNGGVYGQGIYLEGAQIFNVSNNTINNTGANTGIVVYTSTIQEAYIESNRIYSYNESYLSFGGLSIQAKDTNLTIRHNIIDANNQVFMDNSVSLYLKANNTLIYNNTFRNNRGAAIALSGGTGNQIINNTIITNTVAFRFYDYVISNRIYNNLINTTNSTNSTVFSPTVLYSNQFNTTEKIGTRIFSSGTYIGGNYYTNSTGNGYSDMCSDLNSDGFCDSSYTLATDNIDYLPLSAGYDKPVSLLSISPSPVYSYNDLMCNATVIDWVNSSLIVEYVIRNGSTIMWTGNVTNVSNNTEMNIFTVLHENVSSGDLWNCSVRGYDGASYGMWNTTSLTVSNSPPSMYLMSIAGRGNNSNITETMPLIRFNVTDAENSSLVCHIEINSTNGATDEIVWVGFGYNYTVANNTVTSIAVANGTALTNKSYALSMNCTDGTNYALSETWNFTIDTIPPTITVSNPAENGTYSGVVQVKTTISDTVGVSYAFYNITNSTSDNVTQNIELSSPDWDSTWDSSPFPDGNYTLMLWANDSTNNTNTKTVPFKIESSAPTTQIFLPANQSYQRTNFTTNLYFSSTNNISVAKYNITNSTGHVVQSNHTGHTNLPSLNFTDTIPTSFDNWTDGNYTISVWANDTNNAIKGNETSMFTVDKTLPNVTLSTPANFTYDSDGIFAVAYIPYDVYLLNCSLWHNFTGTFSRAEDDTTLTNNATNTFSVTMAQTGIFAVRCYDRAGNDFFTENRTVLYASAPRDTSGGGGGGGGGFTTVLTACGTLDIASFAPQAVEIVGLEAPRLKSESLIVYMKHKGCPVNATVHVTVESYRFPEATTLLASKEYTMNVDVTADTQVLVGTHQFGLLGSTNNTVHANVTWRDANTSTGSISQSYQVNYLILPSFFEQWGLFVLLTGGVVGTLVIATLLRFK